MPETCEQIGILYTSYLPVAFWAILDRAHVVPLDFIRSPSVAFPSLISYVKGHAERLLVGLPIGL